MHTPLCEVRILLKKHAHIPVHAHVYARTCIDGRKPFHGIPEILFHNIVVVHQRLVQINAEADLLLPAHLLYQGQLIAIQKLVEKFFDNGDALL